MMSEERIDFKIRWVVKQMRDNASDLERLALQYADTLDGLTENLKVQQLKPNPMEGLYRCIKDYKTPDNARRKIEEAYQQAKADYEYNLKAIEVNKKVIAAIRKSFEKWGIPETYTVRKTWRGKTTTEKRDWVLATQQLVPLTCSNPEESYKKKLAEVDAWEKELKQKQEQEQRQADADRQQTEATRKIGVYAAKYGLSITATPDDVLDAILAKDKYLRLAYWLRRNRDDWSEGPHYASIGLREFTIEGETDQQIYDCIHADIVDWDGDGRCFRDSTWSYDRIEQLTKDKTLIEDLAAVIEAGYKLKASWSF
jgi:hypothetical protein